MGWEYIESIVECDVQMEVEQTLKLVKRSHGRRTERIELTTQRMASLLSKLLERSDKSSEAAG